MRRAAAAATALFAAGLAGVTLRPHAALLVENRLVDPVAFTVGEIALVLEPGDSTRVPIATGGPVEAHWAAVRPTNGEGRSLGQEFEGMLRVRRPAGDLPAIVHAGSAGPRRVAPVVANRSSRPLRVAVVGAGDSVDCECLLAAGDSLRLGYYRLAPATAVVVTDPGGRSVRFTDLASAADPTSGRLLLAIDDARLGHPARR